MRYIADLHVHSRFSRATSKHLGFESLHRAAQVKGISLVGTGDATHPGWTSEIREKLEPVAGGLFRLRTDLAREVDAGVFERCRAPVRFVLQSEISCIYKKDGKTRKNHHLVYFPDLEAQERFNRSLENIGNIRSDGRPILGLDARSLLEIVLESGEGGVLVPAHIWTPWFSLLGSKSGFDHIEDCYADLTSHIFAVETGLSSDPPMNRRVSWLDGCTLVSNSDAHSPGKLGREANLLDAELTYEGLFEAIRSGDPARFLGTIEFFPEEGKYHLDGHRKCGVRMSPSETRRAGGNCPACGRPATLGVLHRVEALADRTGGAGHETAFTSLVPLTDVLAELLGCGPGTRKVEAAYGRVVSRLGAELAVLKDAALEAIDRVGIPLLGEAVRRMRKGELDIAGGYDGEFGRVGLFAPGERERLLGQSGLFAVEPAPRKGADPPAPAEAALPTPRRREALPPTPALNPEQHQAVEHPGGPLLIVAGPGTGKTHTLTHRIFRLLTEGQVPPERVAAITFTLRAAREMRSRLERLLEGGVPLPFVGTFHAFCLLLIRERWPDRNVRVIDEAERRLLLRSVCREGGGLGVRRAEACLSRAKQQLAEPRSPGWEEAFGREMGGVYDRFQSLLSAMGAMDYEDILAVVVRELEGDGAWRGAVRDRFGHLFVDEYQDLNAAQYRLVRLLARPGHDLFAIGDPDQAIYGFRGSDSAYFGRFIEDHPDATILRLTRNYRSTATLLEAAFQVVRAGDPGEAEARRLHTDRSGGRPVTVLETASARSEAVAVGRRIETMVGGLDFHSVDSRAVDPAGVATERSFADIAVLYRTGAQAEVLHDILTRAGIPCRIAARSQLQEREGVAGPLALLRLAHGSGGFLDLGRAATTLPIPPSRVALDRFRGWALEKAMGVEEALSSMRAGAVPDAAVPRQERLAALRERIHSLRARIPRNPLPDLLRDLFGDVPEEGEAADAVRFLGGLAEAHGSDVAGFLNEVGLLTDADLYRPDAEAVTLMTMHAAKGLEFPVVFVTGCEAGWIPFEDGARAGDPAEERRLFYVAVTRARERLFLTWARRRRIRGIMVDRAPSPFLFDIDAALRQHPATESGRRRNPGQRQMQLF